MAISDDNQHILLNISLRNPVKKKKIFFSIKREYFWNKIKKSWKNFFLFFLGTLIMEYKYSRNVE
jgi:hypothetical protein